MAIKKREKMGEYLLKIKKVFNNAFRVSKWIKSSHIENISLNKAIVSDTWHYFKNLRQYTGFHDKNGKKIFKGEILEWIDTRKRNNKRNCTGIVEWNGVIGLWEVKNNKMHIYDFLCHVYNSSNIIGTYFDNPKPLKELKEE